MMMEESTGHLMNPSQPLLTKLFGARKYQYKLQLDQEFPNTIFRERNINITVKLSDSNSEKVLNCKLLLIQQILSIFVWGSVMQMDAGLRKIKSVKIS
jgi:hypothetical protein